MDTEIIVLAIDDMATDLALVRNILEPHFDVRVAKSGGIAFKILETVTIDIILLDIEMPGMSGFEFLHSIRQSPKYVGIPVIIVSGHSSPEFFSHAMKQGADDCVAKPVDSEELLRKIYNILEHPPKHTLFDLMRSALGNL
ncbi:MAG: response regulator [Spirochaetales bacterium]|jgi:PleD family two-component response regulator|nr:response regulator [Spirochaetales bacterium]